MQLFYDTVHTINPEAKKPQHSTAQHTHLCSQHSLHKPTVMPANGFAFSLSFMFFLLLLCLSNLMSLNGASMLASQGNESMEEEEMMMVPLMEEKMVKMVMNETRRKLNSFQICALCTCCGGAKGMCLPSPCCYAINCNIPNRPFGFCSFTPKTCNCFGCHL